MHKYLKQNPLTKFINTARGGEKPFSKNFKMELKQKNDNFIANTQEACKNTENISSPQQQQCHPWMPAEFLVGWLWFGDALHRAAVPATADAPNQRMFAGAPLYAGVSQEQPASASQAF